MIEVAIQPIQVEELPLALDVLGKTFATVPNPMAMFSGKPDTVSPVWLSQFSGLRQANTGKNATPVTAKEDAIILLLFLFGNNFRGA